MEVYSSGRWVQEKALSSLFNHQSNSTTMKYKAKFTSQDIIGLFHTDKVTEGQVVNTDHNTGVIVFIPFSDTSFFEPVKTRKFQVEVSEDQMRNFQIYCERLGYWTVTEITENEYLKALEKSSDVDLQVIDALRDTSYLEKIVTAYLIIKEREKDKLSVVKGLKDYTNACAASIKGLKNAKDIVYAWWDL